MPSSHTRHDQGETTKTQHVSTVWADGTSHNKKWMKKVQKKECDLFWAEFPEQDVVLNFKQNKYTGCVEYVPAEDPVADAVPDVGGTGAMLGLALMAVMAIKRKAKK